MVFTAHFQLVLVLKSQICFPKLQWNTFVNENNMGAIAYNHIEDCTQYDPYKKRAINTRIAFILKS